MMNILQQEDMVKGLPDDRLLQEARNPSGQMPQFLLVSEVQRRADMRKRYETQMKEQPQGTIADQVLNGGIGSLQQPPAGQGMQQQGSPPGQGFSPSQQTPPPMQPPNAGMPPAGGGGYAAGGLVRMYDGGGTGNAITGYGRDPSDYADGSYMNEYGLDEKRLNWLGNLARQTKGSRRIPAIYPEFTETQRMSFQNRANDIIDPAPIDVVARAKESAAPTGIEKALFGDQAYQDQQSQRWGKYFQGIEDAPLNIPGHLANAADVWEGPAKGAWEGLKTVGSAAGTTLKEVGRGVASMTGADVGQGPFNWKNGLTTEEQWNLYKQRLAEANAPENKGIAAVNNGSVPAGGGGGWEFMRDVGNAGKGYWDRLTGNAPANTGGTAGGGGGGEDVVNVPAPAADPSMAGIVPVAAGSGEQVWTDQGWQTASEADINAALMGVSQSNTDNATKAAAALQPVPGTDGSKAAQERDAAGAAVQGVKTDPTNGMTLDELLAQQRNMAWSNAMMQFGAGIAGGDIAAGMSKAGTAMAEGQASANETMQQQLRQQWSDEQLGLTLGQRRDEVRDTLAQRDREVAAGGRGRGSQLVAEMEMVMGMSPGQMEKWRQFKGHPVMKDEMLKMYYQTIAKRAEQADPLSPEDQNDLYQTLFGVARGGLGSRSNPYPADSLQSRPPSGSWYLVPGDSVPRQVP